MNSSPLLYSHWVMQVRGDAQAVLRKWQRLAGAQAQDVRFMPTLEVHEQSDRIIKASNLEAIPGQDGRYRQHLQCEKILTRIHVQSVDFLIAHAASDWTQLRAEVLEMAARIAPQWRLSLHGSDCISAHTGQTDNWQRLSHVQNLCWSLRQDQCYSRNIPSQ